MNWLSKWFGRKMYQAAREYEESPKERRVYADDFVINTNSSLQHNHNGMNFTIHNANGGFVIEYQKYNSKTDESNRQLYVVHTDEDLGEALSKIITIEIIKS